MSGARIKLYSHFKRPSEREYITFADHIDGYKDAGDFLPGDCNG